MNRIFKLVLVSSAVFFGVNFVLSAAPFEGKMQFQIKEGRKDPLLFDYLIKGGKVRVITENNYGERGTVIVDNAQKKMFVVMDKEKKFIEMSMEPPKGSEKKEAEKADFSKTGKKETILGYACEEWVAKDKNGVSEVWLAKGLGTFLGFGNAKVKQSQTFWQTEVEKQNLFPLRVISKSDSGKEKTRWEVKKIERKNLDASLFKIPASYTKIETGGFKNFMKGFASDGE